MSTIRLPKFVFREGNLYVLRHPSGAVVPLGSTLREAKAMHSDALKDLESTGAHTAAAYRRLKHGMWAHVEVQGRGECWPWKGPVDRDGYGYFRRHWVHRLAWMAHHGEALLPGQVVRHSCDNPGCCNPWHLLVGTQLDNVRDRDVRGRTARGESNGRATLSEAQVLAIYAAEGSYPEIAQRFGVSKSAVSDIKTGRNWGWLTGHGFPVDPEPISRGT